MPRKCLCHYCRETPIPGEQRCSFCSLYCGFTKSREFQIERVYESISQWRAHVLKLGIESEGLDPLVWFERVQSLGTLRNAERLEREDRNLRDGFARAIAGAP